MQRARREVVKQFLQAFMELTQIRMSGTKLIKNSASSRQKKACGEEDESLKGEEGFRFHFQICFIGGWKFFLRYLQVSPVKFLGSKIKPNVES